MTFKRINRAIQHLGLTLVGTRGDGYFYFLDSAGNQVGESVYVCYLNHLPLKDWVALAEFAVASQSN